MDMTCGVPQGSVLKLFLWNVFYIFRVEIPDDITTIGYADDLALITCGEDREIIEEKIK